MHVGLWPTEFSSAALLISGMALLIHQIAVRPRSAYLHHNMLLAATLILWGVLLSVYGDDLPKRLEDIVIGLFVFNYSWLILAGNQGRTTHLHKGSNQKAPPKQQLH